MTMFIIKLSDHRGADNGERAIYTIVAHLPIEADGRIRYRIKSKTENFERVVTEDQIVAITEAIAAG
jgi:hypothetical protein